MDLRLSFDTIPEKFDKWRPRYCPEAFDCIASTAKLGPDKSALELGPGTGQATEPILKTGCDYTAIELGEHLAGYMSKKFGFFANFHIINADFEKYDFGCKKFDLIYSAATIQWIPEKVAYEKCFELLKSGGTLAMMVTRSDYRTPDPALYDDVQKVYAEYFRPETPYTQRFDYTAAEKYGFSELRMSEFYDERSFCADDYVEYIGTHCDHLALPEPYKSKFYEGVRSAIKAYGDKLKILDTIVVYTAEKP